MNRLNVQAAIHPSNMGRALVTVEHEDGSRVLLGSDSFDVARWAPWASAAGDAARYHPSVLFAIGGAPGTYELTLDDVRYNEGDATQQWHEPLPLDVRGAVYLITVHTTQPDAQGRCIVRQS